MSLRYLSLILLTLFLWPHTALGVGPVLRLHGADRYFLTLREVDDVVARRFPRSGWSLVDRYALMDIYTRVDRDRRLLTFGDAPDGLGVRIPVVVSYDQYFDARKKAQFRQLWSAHLKNHIAAVRRNRDPENLLSISMPVELPGILGGGTPVFSVTGSQRIELSGRSEWREDDIRTATNRASRFPSLQMKQQQRFTVSGNIGQKISVTIHQDSEAFTDLENSISLRYEDVQEDGTEGNGIIKRFEAGNVTLSLENAEFTGYTDQHSGLFGLKMESQIGGVYFTTILSQEKGEGQSSSFQAGTQGSQQRINDMDFRRWTYFFVDPGYRANFARRDANGIHFASPDSIEAIRVFVSDRRNIGTDLASLRKAVAYFRPSVRDFDTGQPLTDPATGASLAIPDTTTEAPERADFRELQIDEFFVDRNLGYIALETPLQSSDVLGVYYVTRNRLTGQRVEYGNIPLNSQEEAEIRLLKTRDENPPSPEEMHDPSLWGAWQYEWRNVYFLGKTNINSEGFELVIKKIAGGGVDQDVEAETGTPFIQLLGLDRRGIEPGSPPDRIVDIDYELINFQRGELIFPDLYPFAPGLNVDETGLVRLAFPTTQQNGLADQTPELYTSRISAITTNRANINKYYMEVAYKDRQAQYSLGRSNIIEGSEVVRLNGRKLTPGQDYIMLYEVGQIRFLTEEALAPNADVRVDYQFAPFFKPASNTLMGFQSRYNFNDRSWLRGTMLMRTDKSLDQKSRIGRETGRYMLWDVDTRLNFTPGIMTSMVNALPFVETTRSSNLNISAEIAQSIPNPNTRGDAFVDDFEGAKEETDLGVRRTGWVASSPPDDRAHRQRGKLVWYNPIEQVAVQEIFPTREVVIQDSRQHVLTLEFDPAFPDLRWGGAIDNAFVTEWAGDSPDALRTRWGGLMHPLTGASIDQTRSRFIEVWVNGDRGELHIDLGSISEDVNANGKLDTEDDRSDGFGNDLLDQGEDIGIDGVTDPDEIGFDPLTGTVVPYDPAANPDPHGDNFFFDPAPASRGAFDEVDYSRINGIEDNVNDPDRGRRPDTEDINNSGFLDTRDNYFMYAFNLAPDHPDTAFVAGGDLNTANWGASNSWRLYRIPLDTVQVNAAFEGVVGAPDLALIEMVRIWVTGVETPVKIRIASIQIVGNQWLVDLDNAIVDSAGAVVPAADQTLFGEQFNISVKNTYDNPNDYTPPPGAIIEIDRVTRVQHREQSLVLNYENLQPGHSAQALRTFFPDQDYTLYNDLRLFVYGSSNLTGEQSPEFFIRFGNSVNDYYEYRSKVVPGWDPRNEMRVIFTDLTLLKGDTEAIRQAGRDTTFTLRFSDGMAHPVIVRDGTTVNRKMAMLMLEDGRQYRVQGNPSLSRIRQYIVGVSNPYPHPLDRGEIWIDELRTGDVRQDKGMAGRISVDASFADFMTLRGSFRRMDSHYRLIGQPETGSTNTSFNVNSGFNLHKFFPEQWGLSMPVQFNIQRDRRLPRLLVGSDIVLIRPDDREEQRTESARSQFSARYAKRGVSNNLLAAWTLDRLQLAFNSSENFSRSVTREDTTSTYDGSLNYNLSPRKQRSVEPFKWADASFVPEWFSGMQFQYLPTTLTADARIQRTKQTGINRQFTGNRTDRFTRNLYRTVRGRMNPVPPLSVDYSLALVNDMRADSTISLKDLRFGRETSYNQSFGIDFRPAVASWLRPGYSFRTSYLENRNPELQVAGTSPDDRTITQNNQRQITANLDVERMLTSAFGRADPEQEAGLGANLWYGFRRFVGIMNSINMRYETGSNQSLFNIRSRPGFAYRFGFSDDPDVTTAATDSITGITTIQQDRTSTSTNFNMDTGFRPVSGLDITTRSTWRSTQTQSVNTNIATNSLTWPDMSTRWSPALRRLPSLSRVVQRLDFNTGYARRVDENRNNNLMLSSAATGLRPETRTETTTLSPVLGVAVAMANGLGLNAKYDATDIRTFNGLSATDQRQENRTLTVSLDYRVRPGVRIPFFGDKPLQGNLNLQTQVVQSSTVTLLSRDGSTFRPSNGQKQLSIRLRSDYQFSRRVRGGLTIEWTNTENTVTKEKRRIRQGGFWTEFQFN